MSRKNLNHLLDSMLEDSAAAQEALEVRRLEEAERARAVAAVRAKEPAAPPTLNAIVQLTGLTEGDLRKVMGTAAPDDILVVLATADDVLQRRILRNMSDESVLWLRQNLAHMEQVSDHERDQARAKLLKVANKLLAAGTIGVPEPASIGADEAPDAVRKELRALLVDLVTIAAQAGPEALSELAASAGEPVLREGLERVLAGVGGDALRGELRELRAELESRYAQRLKWMVEALVAIAEGESAESFSERVFGGE